MTTQAYSQRHLISVAEMASAIATARGTTGIDELRELAGQAEGGVLATLPLYPPHQLWQHRGDVNRIGVPTENPVVIWRMLAAKVCKPHLSDKDAFNYPPAASTWHMLAADVYGLGMTRSLNRRAAAALRELAIRYSPELGDDEAEMLKPVTGPAEPVVEPAPPAVLVTDQVAPEAPQVIHPEPLPSTAERALNPATQMETATKKIRAKRKTWMDVSGAYIAEVMQAGQYGTAKELFRALEAKAGPNSPFDKGEAAYRGSLFVREINQSVTLKTIQNRFPELCELTRK